LRKTLIKPHFGLSALGKKGHLSGRMAEDPQGGDTDEWGKSCLSNMPDEGKNPELRKTLL